MHIYISGSAHAICMPWHVLNPLWIASKSKWAASIDCFPINKFCRLVSYPSGGQQHWVACRRVSPSDSRLCIEAITSHFNHFWNWDGMPTARHYYLRSQDNLNEALRSELKRLQQEAEAAALSERTANLATAFSPPKHLRLPENTSAGGLLYRRETTHPTHGDPTGIKIKPSPSWTHTKLPRLFVV